LTVFVRRAKPAAAETAAPKPLPPRTCRRVATEQAAERIAEQHAAGDAGRRLPNRACMKPPPCGAAAAERPTVRPAAAGAGARIGRALRGNPERSRIALVLSRS